MRIVSFQDKVILEELVLDKIKPLFECNIVVFKKREEELHNRIKNKMIGTMDIPKDRMFVPMWGWVIPKNQELTTEYLDSLYDRHAPSCDRIVAFELEVPKELLLISNFKEWQELLFKCTFNQEITDLDFDKLFEKQNGAILQVCMPFIHKAHILSYKDYNDFKSKDYSNTEGIMQKEINDGTVELDPTGQFILKYKDS